MSQSAGRTVMVQGRIVWTVGDLFKGRKKTQFGTQTPQLNQQGEQIVEFGFGLAVPKAALSQPAQGGGPNVWQELHAEALSMFPGAQQVPPSFSLKFKDGDGIDDKGIPFSQREGYAGHIVLSCTTQLPIKFFKWENGANIMINEGIKCGDYVNVQLQIKAHPAIGAGKAGLYVNPSAVQFLGFGKEIVNAPSGDQIFGVGAPPQMGSPTPLAPQGGQLVPSAPPMPGMPQQQAAPAPAPQQQQAPAPHFGVLPQQHQPPAGGMPMGNGYPAAPSNAPPATMQPTQFPGAPAGPAAQPSYPMTQAPHQQWSPQQAPQQQWQQPAPGGQQSFQPQQGMPAMPGYPPQQ